MVTSKMHASYPMPSHGPVVKHTLGNGAVLDENSGDESAFDDPQANEVVIF
jgi:hypothetical protein